jgi:hypothetical protein
VVDTVLFGLTLFGGIVGFVWLLIFLDWLGRRKDRQSKQRPAM